MLLAWSEDLLLLFNSSFAAVLGDRWANALGKRMPDVWAAAWPDFRHHVDKAISGEAVLVEDFRVATQRSGFEEVAYFSFTYAPLKGKEETAGLLCVCLETTETVRRQREFKKMQSDLIHLSRVTAMETMASSLAHELNQPLTALNGYLSGAERLIRSPTPLPLETLAEALQGARESATRAADIVRRTREMLKKGVPRSEPVAADRLIASAAELVTADLHRMNVACEVEAGAFTWVEADAIQIQQVLLNLIRNSLDAMQESSFRRLRIAARAAEGNVLFSVEDNGSGVGDAAKAQLFKAFQTSKKTGLGVGLSISRTIVEAHRGRLWLERSSQAGSLFCFTLPATVQ
jgi:two-component system sensor kinase FixL